MALISDEYRRMNAELHDSNSEYGSRGDKWARRVQWLAKQHGCNSILDYGCGKGSLVKALGIRGYDPAVKEYAALPEPADMVVCVDVLEHVEPDKIKQVIRHLRELTNVVLFAVVATRASNKDLPDGRNAHLIVESSDWWVPRLKEQFGTVEVSDSSSMAHWWCRGYINPPLEPGREFSATCLP